MFYLERINIRIRKRKVQANIFNEELKNQEDENVDDGEAPQPVSLIASP